MMSPCAVRVGNPVDGPAPQFFMPGPTFPRSYDLQPDGRLVGIIDSLTNSAMAGTNGPQIQVVLNWTEELNQRVVQR